MKVNHLNQFVVIILVLLFFSLAASTPGLGLLIESTTTSTFPQVEVSLSAWNSEGLPLSDLGKANFLVQENGGIPFAPDEVCMDRDAPLSVALVLDISGSMQGQPLADAKVAAARFLDRLSPGDQAALIAFSDNVDPDPLGLNPERELAFTSNLTPVYDLVESLQAQGGTHLYNAVQKAVAMTQALPSGHRAVLVLSDGVNEPADVGDPEAPISLAKENGIPIYVIGLGNKIDEPYLRRLGSETGGLFRLAPRSSELAQTFDDMAALLKTQYTLVYTSKALSGAESIDLSITLKVAGAAVTAETVLKNIPALQTATPEPTATEIPVFPTATTAPTENLATLLPVVTPEPPTGLVGFLLALPLYAWLLLTALVVLCAFLLIRLIRRRPKTIEKCAKCGYILAENANACPQCGEIRHISVSKKSK